MPRARKKGVQAQDGGSGLDIPRGPFVGLWKMTAYSDVCIRLVSAPPKKFKTQQDAPCTDQAVAAGSVFKEILAHKEVLTAGSTYFQGLLTTGQDIAAQPTMETPEREIRRSKRKHEELCQATYENNQILSVPCDTKEEADAMKSVLKFLYTHDLPASPTVRTLTKMITAADYLGADLCVKACAISLSTHPINKNDLPQVYGVLDMMRRCSACNPKVMEGVQDVLSGQLLKTYSIVPDIVNNDELLLSFCSLPLDAVVAWGRSDDLEVDSENTVVVVLNKWWQSQSSDARTEECKKQLSKIVRPAFLSSGYLLDALDKLEWFVPPFSSYKFACSAYNQDIINTNVKPCRDLNTIARVTINGADELNLNWHLLVSQIQPAVRSNDVQCIQGPSGYSGGHTWSLFLKISPADEHDSDDDDADDYDNGQENQDRDEDELRQDDGRSDVDDDGHTDSEDGDDAHDDQAANDGHWDGGVNTVKLRLGIKKGVASGMPDEIPATAHVKIKEGPFELSWEKYPFDGNQVRFKTMPVEAQDVAAGLREYARNNQLAIKATITTLE